jgi:hypothetical protein
MCNPGDSDPLRSEEAPCETACSIAEQIAPLVREAREKGFDFLAYLLGMALKESRRLSDEQNGS